MAPLVDSHVHMRVYAVRSTICFWTTKADDIKDRTSLLVWEIDRWGSTIEDHKAVVIALLIGWGERSHPESLMPFAR